jgi:hypothetical protein
MQLIEASLADLVDLVLLLALKSSGGLLEVAADEVAADEAEAEAKTEAEAEAEAAEEAAQLLYLSSES